MRYLFCIFFSTMMLSCLTTRKETKVIDDNSFFVKKIDKKNSWYIIYAKRRDTLYKIVSKTDTSVDSNCKRIIAVGNKYAFDLKSNKKNAPTVGGVKLDPVGYLGCYQFDAKTTICLEPNRGIYDLFYADNLKGLCYME